MKKTYINPDIQVVMMKMNQHLLDGSPGSKTLNKNATQISDSNDIGGRAFNFDLDED
jgi:hypothetical protein